MSGIGVNKDYSVDVNRDNAIMAATLGTPATFPTVVGKSPAPPPASAADLIAKVGKTIEATPIDPAPLVPANKYDDVVAAAVAKGANKFSDLASPGYTQIGTSAPTAPTPAPVAAPIKAPTMNPVIMEQQQNLMAQIANAQSVVQAGSNRDGYKMGDVTKALATMNSLSPLVSSSNNLMSATYGVDAGMVNHAADNTTRLSISDAGNQTELAKTDLAGQYGIQGRVLDNEAAYALVDTKAKAEAATPSGQLAAFGALLKKQELEDNTLLSPQQRIDARFAPSYGVLTDNQGNPVGLRRNAAVQPFSPEDRVNLAPPKLEKK